MSTCERIWIEATGLGASGLRYRVTHNGVTLIESTRSPECDSARALLARGILGQVEVWRRDVNYPAMRFDVEKAAQLTIEESDRSGPRFIRWQPRIGNAVSTSGGYARTAGDKVPATYPSDRKSAVLDHPLGPNSRFAA